MKDDNVPWFIKAFLYSQAVVVTADITAFLFMFTLKHVWTSAGGWNYNIRLKQGSYLRISTFRKYQNITVSQISPGPTTQYCQHTQSP